MTTNIEEKVTSVLFKVNSNREFKDRVVVVEEVLKALEVPYVIPNDNEIHELVSTFRKLIKDHRDISIKIKKNTVEIKFYVNEGSSGDWWDTDVYTYFGFKQLVEFEKRRA